MERGRAACSPALADRPAPAAGARRRRCCSRRAGRACSTVALEDAGGALRRAAGRRRRRAGGRRASTSPRRGRSVRTSPSRGCGPARARRGRSTPRPSRVAFTRGRGRASYRSHLGRGGARLRAARHPHARLTHYSRSRMTARRAIDDGGARRCWSRSLPPRPRPRSCAGTAARRRTAPRCATRAGAARPLRRARRAGRRCASRASRSARKRGRYLMYLSGGPGGAGVVEMIDVLLEVPRLARDFTVLGFDQRGTGRSGLLRCRELERDARLRSTTAGEELRAAARAGARVLHDARLASRTWRRSARRSGRRKLTLFGISYGTELALAYARAYPQRVERLILDSTVGSRRERPVRARRASARWRRRCARSARTAAAASAPTRRPTSPR